MTEALRTMLSGKIHRATVTCADLEYVGSISLDRGLMQAAGIAEWEQVHVLDVTNGARLQTYAIVAPEGSGEVCINGAAAHLVDPGDLVIVLAYAQVPESQVANHRPHLVHLDGANRPVEVPRDELPASNGASRAEHALTEVTR